MPRPVDPSPDSFCMQVHPVFAPFHFLPPPRPTPSHPAPPRAYRSDADIFLLFLERLQQCRVLASLSPSLSSSLFIPSLSFSSYFSLFPSLASIPFSLCFPPASFLSFSLFLVFLLVFLKYLPYCLIISSYFPLFQVIICFFFCLNFYFHPALISSHSSVLLSLPPSFPASLPPCLPPSLPPVTSHRS